jgi:hypothetical protein
MYRTIKNNLINVSLRLLQILLGLYYVTGGIYMSGNYKDIASTWALSTFPNIFWIVLAILEISLGLGLFLSGVSIRLRRFTFGSAVGLALLSLSGIVLYSAYAGSGALWAAVPALLLMLIAYNSKH